MNVFSLCGFGICTVLIAFILKQIGSGFHPAVTAVAGVLMLSYMSMQTLPVLQYMRSLAEESGMNDYFVIAVKALGVALICQLASEICRDFGETAVGSRIELAGKTAIIAMSLPLLKNLMAFAKELM